MPGADDFIGAAVLRGVRGGPVAEHRLALCDRQGRPVGFSGQTAMLQVRVAYAPAGADAARLHEAPRKAAQLALARSRRQSGGGPGSPAPGTPGETLRALQPPGNPGEAPSPQRSPRGLALAAAWKQAYSAEATAGGGTDAEPRARPGGPVHTDLVAMPPPPAIFAGSGTDKENRGGDLDPADLPALRKELAAKAEQAAPAPRAAPPVADAVATTVPGTVPAWRLRERARACACKVTLSLVKSPNADGACLRQMRKLQALVEASAPAQQRLEEQLASAQQLVRGSLLQVRAAPALRFLVCMAFINDYSHLLWSEAHRGATSAAPRRAAPPGPARRLSALVRATHLTVGRTSPPPPPRRAPPPARLRASGALSRGNLCAQHERYEAAAEQQARELEHLRREKERAERQLHAARRETDVAADSGGSTLQEVLEVERARFKRAVNAAADAREGRRAAAPAAAARRRRTAQAGWARAGRVSSG